MCFRILGQMFGGTPGGNDSHPFSIFFNGLLNPANARSGDAVYSQEAFDRVMSQLMEQHTSGSAPGPASEAAIAALPRKAVDESMLGETGTAECSICMDSVQVGDRVMSLPCKHWFHPACAEAWLTEHDTCPICRAGITPKDGPRDTARSPGQTPLNNQDPFELARQQSGSQAHPYIIDESPTAARRRPQQRRPSSGQADEQAAEESGALAGIAERVRGFFTGSGGGNGTSGGGGGNGGERGAY